MKLPWVVVRREELSYLKGMTRSAGDMQRSRTRFKEWGDQQQQKLRRMREQIACDQAYIDALEEAVSAEDLKRIRIETSGLRHRRSKAEQPLLWSEMLKLEPRLIALTQRSDG